MITPKQKNSAEAHPSVDKFTHIEELTSRLHFYFYITCCASLQDDARRIWKDPNFPFRAKASKVASQGLPETLRNVVLHLIRLALREVCDGNLLQCVHVCWKKMPVWSAPAPHLKAPTDLHLLIIRAAALPATNQV